MSIGNEVLVHVTSADSTDWKAALRNVSNLYHNESVPTPGNQFKMVVNGDAVRNLLSGAPEADRIARMIDAGIQIEACRNSLGHHDYDAAALIDGVGTVESGVAEVVRLQRHGVTYLKLP